MALILAATRRMSETEAILRAGGWDGFRADRAGSGSGCRARRSASSAWAASARRRRDGRRSASGCASSTSTAPPVGPFDFAAEALPSIAAVHGGGGRRLAPHPRRRRQPRADLGRAARGDEADGATSSTPRAATSSTRRRWSRRSPRGGSPARGSTSMPRSRRCRTACSRLPNVTLLPHIGSATVETRTAMGMLAVDNLDRLLRGRRRCPRGWFNQQS